MENSIVMHLVMKRVRVMAILFGVFASVLSCKSPESGVGVSKGKVGGIFELNENGKGFEFRNDGHSIKLDTTSFISFDHFLSVKQEEAPIEKLYMVAFQLDEEGTTQLEKMSARNKKGSLAFVINNRVISMPAVAAEPITTGEFHLMIADKKVFDEVMQYLQK